jgi:predicted nucleic acid-binding protein
MILVDAGPLVALPDSKDPHHAICTAVVSQMLAQPLITTWPCFTEAVYLLGNAGGYRQQAKLWRLRASNRLQLLDLTSTEIDRAEKLMTKYADLPMDLGDATLIAVAESRSFSRIFTLDSDFRVYRLRGGAVLEIVP